MDFDKLRNLEYLSQKYDITNIPLYLSYPTQRYWNNTVEEDIFIEDFKNIHEPFLYFHFPFCKKACYFCACYKDVTTKDNDYDVYLEYLKKEFDYKVNKLAGTGKLSTYNIHWGGGTPTLMNCNQIEKAFSMITDKVSIIENEKTSISLEAYPDGNKITDEKLKLLKELGFTEISFGIQDFDDNIQQAINRDCNLDTTRKIVERAKHFGFKIHIDLCYGLPFQGLNEIRKTVLEVINLDVDRVAIFPYAHYPLTFPAQKMIPTASIPNFFVKLMLVLQAEELLFEHGYKEVGTDHFVKPDNFLYKYSCDGKVRKDFMGYSVDFRKYCLGFGKAAISVSDNGFYHNLIPLKEYYTMIDNNRIPLQRKNNHTLSQDDILREEIILKEIMCNFKVDKRSINERYSIDFDDYFSLELEQLATLEKDGLVKLDNESIEVTKVGKYFARNIGHIFDIYYR